MPQTFIRQRPTKALGNAVPLDLNMLKNLGVNELTGHAWKPRIDGSSLLSLSGTRKLALQGDPPVYSPTFASLSPSASSALLTELVDTSTLKLTLGMVFRHFVNQSGVKALWHNKNGTSGISAFFNNDPALQLNLGQSGQMAAGLNFPRSTSGVNAWCFLGLTFDFSLTTNNVRVFGGDPANLKTLSVTDHQPNVTGKIAINRQFGGTTGVFDCAYAFAYRDQFATLDTFNKMLTRTAAMLAPDGITITNATAA